MTDLPKNVRPETDRHGKVRYRFRKVGYKSAMIPGEPGSPEMLRAVAHVLEANKLERRPIASTRKHEHASLDHAFHKLKQLPSWQDNTARYQHVAGQVIERFLDLKDKKDRRYGRRPCKHVTVGWLNRIFGQMSDRPGAANDLRKKLKILMNVALAEGWISSNPVVLTSKYKDGEGHKDWTDVELEQFRTKHALGSMARLTLELTLNVAGRACEVNKIERSHIKGGRIFLRHAKGSQETSVPMLSTTRAAIKAMPSTPIRYLVVTHFGKPFTDKGMSKRMRKWCDEAGLPQCSMHGLKKSISRQLVESGATDAEGQAITGHKSTKIFGHYRAAADQKRMADTAMARLEQKIAEPATPSNCRTSGDN